MKKGRKKRKGSFLKKFIYAFVITLLVVGGIATQQVYHRVYQPNVILEDAKTAYFYIPTGSNYQTVVDSLYEKGYIRNLNTLKWIAEKKNYPNNVHPGRYLLRNKMSNNELIDLLRSGEQEPVKVTFNTVRTKEELAGRVSENLEADSLSILQLLNQADFIRSYGFNQHTVLTLFIPNTYEFYWNTSAEEFFQRMAREYKAFWTPERKQKAAGLGLSQSEVSILASIVQAEQNFRRDERPRVAGLYINRLRKKMKLESDPTIIYANGNYHVKRVLNVDRKIDSPYNTYRYRGLPPGPINLPEIASIDAVLNYEKHNFIFMCAKEDFSGYHNFSETYRQHQIHARRYRQELNKRKIYR